MTHETQSVFETVRKLFKSRRGLPEKVFWTVSVGLVRDLSPFTLIRARFPQSWQPRLVECWVAAWLGLFTAALWNTTCIPGVIMVAVVAYVLADMVANLLAVFALDDPLKDGGPSRYLMLAVLNYAEAVVGFALLNQYLGTFTAPPWEELYHSAMLMATMGDKRPQSELGYILVIAQVVAQLAIVAVGLATAVSRLLERRGVNEGDT